MSAGEQLVPELRDENQMAVERENAVPAGSDACNLMP
jgi:hypothetical protein